MGAMGEMGRLNLPGGREGCISVVVRSAKERFRESPGQDGALLGGMADPLCSLWSGLLWPADGRLNTGIEAACTPQYLASTTGNAFHQNIRTVDSHPVEDPPHAFRNWQLRVRMSEA